MHSHASSRPATAKPAPSTSSAVPAHLPEAVSGHNTLWSWGPGKPRATTVVAVVPGLTREGAAQAAGMLHRDFASVRIAATVGNSAHETNQEEGGRIYLCQGPVRPWGLLWPSLRHYS